MGASRIAAIRTRDGESLVAQRLTPAYGRRHIDKLLAIHNQIPHVRWSAAELLGGRELAPRYAARWQMSAVVRHGREPVAMLIAFLRQADEHHPLESAYVHRLAVRRDWQRRGVGSALMRLSVLWYFTRLPWLLTVTTQTNDEPSNVGVLEFYEKLGFSRSYQVRYPDKQDVLLEFDRARWVPTPTRRDTLAPIELAGTPFDARPPWGVPQVYFGTSSREKLSQYEHLMRCYGLGLRRLRPTVSLIEPQVEGHDTASEAALVAEPLKWFSRFAANAGTYPVVIEDTMLFIEHFNNDWPERAILPGADTKRWWQALGADGLLQLMKGSKRRRARYVCQLGVNAGPGVYRTFRAELVGSIVRELSAHAPTVDRFPLSNGTFFHAVFAPEGEQRTLAQLTPEEFLLHDYRRRCVAAAAPFLHECAARPRQIELFNDPGW